METGWNFSFLSPELKYQLSLVSEDLSNPEQLVTAADKRGVLQKLFDELSRAYIDSNRNPSIKPFLLAAAQHLKQQSPYDRELNKKIENVWRIGGLQHTKRKREKIEDTESIGGEDKKLRYDVNETLLTHASKQMEQSHFDAVIQSLLQKDTSEGDRRVFFERHKDDPKCYLVMQCAIEKGIKAVGPLLSAFLKAGLDINRTVSYAYRSGNFGSDARDVPLFAVALRDKLVFHQLILYGADVNARFGEGENLLHFVLNHEFLSTLSIVERLVNHGIDINAARNDGATPVHLAVYPASDVIGRRNFDILPYLVEKGAEVNVARNDGMTPLSQAIVIGKKDFIQYLCKNGADINVTVRPDGTTPLLLATQANDQGVVKLLIKNGADVNKARKDGTTPLLLALQMRDVDLVRLLVDGGARISFTGNVPSLLAANVKNAYADMSRVFSEIGKKIVDANQINDVKEKMRAYREIRDIWSQGARIMISMQRLGAEVMRLPPLLEFLPKGGGQKKSS